MRLQCPNVPIVALTATAKSEVRDHVCQILRLKQPLVKVLPIYRPNLILKRFDRKKDCKMAKTLELVIEKLKESSEQVIETGTARRRLRRWLPPPLRPADEPLRPHCLRRRAIGTASYTAAPPPPPTHSTPPHPAM